MLGRSRASRRGPCPPVAAMFVDRIYFPVTTLGPGERVVVWTCGCTKRCPGCANPELWETRPEAAIGPRASLPF